MSSVRRPHGRLFQIRGPAAPKLLSPKLLCVRGTAHMLSEEDRRDRRLPSGLSVEGQALGCVWIITRWVAILDQFLILKMYSTDVQSTHIQTVQPAVSASDTIFFTYSLHCSVVSSNINLNTHTNEHTFCPCPALASICSYQSFTLLHIQTSSSSTYHPPVWLALFSCICSHSGTLCLTAFGSVNL